MHLPISILRPFLGARIIKTGLAAFIVLALFHVVDPSYATFAAVAAILAVQPSISRAKEVFAEQMLGNLIGGLVGTLLGLWLGPSSLAMALAVVVVLGICSRLRLTEAANLAVVIVLFVMDRPRPDFLYYSAARVITISGGMLIGALVNRFVHPPRYADRLAEEIAAGSEGVESFIKHLIRSLLSPDLYQKEDIKNEAAAVQRRLEAARYYLDLTYEQSLGDSRRIPRTKTISSLFVFTERIMDIHKIVLNLGGLTPGLEHDKVAEALSAILRWKREAVTAALQGYQPDPKPGSACMEAIAHLERHVHRLVDDPPTRTRGLGLHGLLTNIQHMAWRMESLTRLLRTPED